MSAKTFLSVGAWTELERVLPLERWFCKQREGLGYEAWTYAMIRVSRANTILQWGFDETKLDGVSTMNQWVLLQEGDHAPEVVTIEAADWSNSGRNSRANGGACAEKLGMGTTGCFRCACGARTRGLR
jgi:hypothetical protein